MEHALDLSGTNQCRDSALRPGATLAEYLPQLDLDRLTCYRCEVPYVGSLVGEMAAKGKLVLVFSLGPFACGILARTEPDDFWWMKPFRKWHTYGLSKVLDAGREVLRSTIPIPSKTRVRGVSGSKRGPVLGYSDKSLSTHRRTCAALEAIGWIQGGITIGKLPEEPKLLRKFQESCIEIFKRLKIPFYAGWEGRQPHFHALIGLELSEEILSELKTSISWAFERRFNENAPEKLVVWKAGNSEAVSRYIGKKFYRNGDPVKGNGSTDWLTWTPCFSHAVPWQAVKEAREQLPPMPDKVVKRGMARK